MVIKIDGQAFEIKAIRFVSDEHIIVIYSGYDGDDVILVTDQFRFMRDCSFKLTAVRIAP